MPNLVCNSVSTKVFDSKEFFFHREQIVRYLYDKGVVFLSFKIDCSADWLCTDEVHSVDKIKERLRFFSEVELPTIQLIDFFSSNVKICSRKNIDGVDSFYYTMYALVGYRSLFEYNESVVCQMKNYFPTQEHLVDVSCLKSLDEVIKFWTFMVDSCFFFSRLEDFYLVYFQKKDEVRYGSIADFFLSLSAKFSLKGGFHKNHPDSYIDGLNFRILQDRSVILLNLIKVFMQENKMFVSEGWVYQKDLKNLNLEHEIVKIESLFELTALMSSFFSNRFPSQYVDNYFYNLVLEQAEVTLRKIKAVPSLLPQRF